MCCALHGAGRFGALFCVVCHGVMAVPDLHTLPRVYVPDPLAAGVRARLSEASLRHIRASLRRPEGAQLRAFNGADGEWLARIEGAFIVSLEQVRAQPAPAPGPTLLFAPIKREPRSFLISQAVELGAGALRPVMTARTQGGAVRALGKLGAKVAGAVEQSERLVFPEVFPVTPLRQALSEWPESAPLYVCLERRSAGGAAYIGDVAPGPGAGFLVGPEGGFDPQEMQYLEGLAECRAQPRARDYLCNTLPHRRAA